MPIASLNGLQAIASTEDFITLNSTRGGARLALDQWQTFGGFGFPLASRARLELGYLNQCIIRPSDDRVNQVLSTTLFIPL